MDLFKDKTILVTGAGSGIGREVALEIARNGGRVVLVGRTLKKLQDTIQRMKNSQIHIAYSCDMAKVELIDSIFKELKKSNVIMNGVVHCAGVADVLPLRIMNREKALKLFDIHYFAFIELVRCYCKKGVADAGSIVGVSSINAHTPQKCMTAYAAAKAAVESACQTLALELVEKNMRINSVVVGGVKTDIAQNTNEIVSAIQSDYVNPVFRQLLGMLDTKQIADVILFLLSDKSSCITGRTIYADGGLL